MYEGEMMSFAIVSQVLMTSGDDILAALPPPLLAEAQLLRERAGQRYREPQLASRFTSDRGVGTSASRTPSKKVRCSNFVCCQQNFT